MTSKMRTVCWSVLLTATLLLAANADAQNKKGQHGQPKLYRWVDQNGEVHFSETPPPDIQNDTIDLREKKGGGWQKDRNLEPPTPPSPPKSKSKAQDTNELPRDKSGLKRPAPRYTPAQLRAQQDALLLLQYDSDKEILDAMNVEIKQLDYDRRVLNTSRKSLAEAYRGNIREAAERQRAGVKVDKKLISQISQLKQRLVDNQASLNGLKVRAKSIREKFGAELDRYRKLVAAQSEAKN